MRYVLLITLAVVVGCKAPTVKRASPPIPTMPLPRIVGVQQAASTEPKTVRIFWEYPEDYPVTFEVWASADLVNWTLSAEVVDWFTTIPMKDQEFFRVRAKDLATGEVSNWATTRSK